jgi:hypothetical protein
VSTDRDQRRATALTNATELFAWFGGDRQAEEHPAHTPRTIARRVTDVAEAFEHWLARPAPIATVKPIAGTPVPRDNTKGTPVSLVMPDDDMVVITATAFDNEKVPVASDFSDPNGPFVAPFTWAADNEALVEMAPAADTLSVNVRSVPGSVGTVAIVGTDVNGKALAPFTIEIDPGAVATAGAVAGTPVPRDDAPPA